MNNEQYLEQFKISDKKYIIGIFQNGITVYKQQIRALNIFDALVKTGRISTNKEFTIGIVGAGVAGLTFAAAALKSNINVILVEQSSNYLHLQHECLTRHIHPNLYDWPNDNAFVSYTELPVLNWKGGRAGNVARQIIKKFEIIENNLPCEISFIDLMDCSNPLIKETSHGFNIYRQEDDDYAYHCDLIIYAVGYGREKGVSYWENDSKAQLNNNYTEKNIIISGPGDGGISDAFRFLIKGYTNSLIFDILRSNEAKYNLLREKLLFIKNRIRDEKNQNLHSHFIKINPRMYSYIIDELTQKNLFSNKHTVYIHGKYNKIEEVYDFNKISMLNAFLLFIFKQNKNISYITGILEEKDNTDYLNGENVNDKFVGGTKVFKRYGTDRDEVINGLKLNLLEKIQLDHIKKIQQETKNHGIVEPRWKISEFSKIFNKNDKHYEFYTEDMVFLLNKLTHKLYIRLRNAVPNSSFRLSLHRLIEIDKDKYYQQITPYHGYNEDFDYKDLGQVHNINRGNVGYSFKTGKPALILRKNELEFKEIINIFNLNSEYNKFKHTKSFLSVPILAPFENKNKIEHCANIVLYIDSFDLNFFGSFATTKDESEVLNIIYDYLNAITLGIDADVHIHGRTIMYPLTFIPLSILEGLSEYGNINNSCWVCHENFKQPNFIFDKFHSCNAISKDNNTLLY